MKQFYIILSFFVIAAAIFGSYKGVALAAGQSSRDAISQSGNLCGGTGGNGKIVSVGNKTFTIKRNDDGRSQIIHLTNQPTIKTSTGPISVSELKNGERVTLVGGTNSDGSFTADTVLVCAITITGTSPTIRNEHANFNNLDAAIALWKVFLLGLIWFGIVVFLWLKKKKSFVYLLFFTIFYVYLYNVLDYTLFQFQSLVFERYFMPGLMLKGIAAGKSLNLIPLVTLRLQDVRTSLLNILLMMPFGFGLPFITNFRMEKVVVIGMLLSIGIEFLQFITGFIGNMTFRIADINDVIFNTLGVAIGYMLFVGFIRNYRHIFHNWKILANPILRYIAERPQVNKQPK